MYQCPRCGGMSLEPECEWDGPFEDKPKTKEELGEIYDIDSMKPETKKEHFKELTQNKGTTTNFKKGDQIVYIPNHAKDMHHPDAEFGFITGFSPSGSAFCRYWLNPYRTELRTTANSEATPIDTLYKCNLKSQKFIDAMLVKLGY